jgi:hypothetical protein
MQRMANIFDLRQPVIYVKNSKLKIDETSINCRLLAVSLATFGLILSVSISAMTLPLALLPGGCYLLFERVRAKSALNAKAVEIFMKSEKNSVPEKIMHYLFDHPLAVRKLCQQPLVDLKKVSSKSGKTLLEYSTQHKFKVPIANSVIREIEQYGSLKNEDYKKLLMSSKLEPETAIFLLKQGKIVPSDFTDNQLEDCLNNIEDSKVLEAMHYHGFNLNIEGAFLSAIINKRWSCVSVYLKTGAKRPNPQTEFYLLKTSNQDEKPQKMTFKELLETKPIINKLLDQIQGKSPSSLSVVHNHIFAYWKPAVSVGESLKVRDEVIELRTITITCAAFCSSLVAAVASLSVLPLLAVIPVTYLYYKWEWSRATQLLNQIAIKQFQSSLPQKGILEYIARNNDVELIDRLEEDLTRVDEDEKDLYHWVCHPHYHWVCESQPSWEKQQKKSSRFTIFKKLVDVIFANELPVEQKYSCLLKAIKSGHSEFVDYLLASKKIKASEFTPGQQFEFFTEIVDGKTAELLCKKGFNINSKSGKYTPLLYLSLRNKFSYYPDQFSLFKHVAALLGADADVNATIDGQGVLDLYKDEQILRLFKT